MPCGTTPEWLVIAVGFVGMLPAIVAGIWVFDSVSKVGRRAWAGDFHRQRLYDCAGILAGILLFCGVTLVTLPIALSTVC